MWERTLQDLIRGLRANKGDENKFVQKAIDEIRVEIKGKDMQLKAGAVLKLTYLDMLGYDMSWASFYVVEVMSSPRYHLKNIGHLAACQSFTPQTDVLMLTTNLLKKEMSAPPVELSLSLNTLSQIVTPDLARDLAHDIVTLLTHSRAHIRKRAVVALFNACSQYPEILPAAFTRLRAMLEDPDPGVVVATVDVITELARKDPASYLNLAPQLFHILTTSSNNWILIKVMKLFACLAPLEPRLVKKLQAPMSDLISTTSAISLLYECVRTCITGGMLSGASGNSLARACVDKLSGFLQNEDQNLRYIALLALLKLVPTHPYMVAEYEEMIMSSIDEPDISIRMRALDLVSAMATQDNLQSLVARLLSHLVPASAPLPSATSALTAVQTSAAPPVSPSLSPSYRAHLSQLILSLGCRDAYNLVTDFNWYLSVLADLTYVANAPGIGAEIARQLLDVSVRAKSTHRFAVELMTKILGDENLLLRANEDDSCPEVLGAAAWICGEYSVESTDRKVLLYYLTRPAIASLPLNILSLYLHSTLKIYGTWAANLAARWDSSDLTELNRVVEMIMEGIEPFVASDDIEVQERAANALQLFAFVRADLSSHKQPNPTESTASDAPAYPKSLFLVRPLFSAFELKAVAPQAQASIPIPEGLRLNEWIVPPEKDAVDLWDGEEEEASVGVVKGTKKVVKKRKVKKTVSEQTSKPETVEEVAERERRRAERLERLRDDPYYIPTSTSNGNRASQADDLDSIPVVKLQLGNDLSIPVSRASSATPANGPSQAATAPLIATEGEMSGAAPAAVPSEAIPTEPPTPALPAPQPQAPASIPSFPEYEVPDEGVSTPEPIKVSRVKKSTKKKKRVAEAA